MNTESSFRKSAVAMIAMGVVSALSGGVAFVFLLASMSQPSHALHRTSDRQPAHVAQGSLIDHSVVNREDAQDTPVSPEMSVAAYAP